MKIDIDFKALYPNCYNILGNYELKLEKIFGALMTKVKDYNSRNLLISFTDIENPSESKSWISLLFYAFYELNYLQ
ncbi:hypothetical protein QTP88_028273 [Uroleucon formosanum]